MVPTRTTRFMSLRSTTMRWVLGIVAAFGVGAVIAAWTNGSDASNDASPRAVTSDSTTSVAEHAADPRENASPRRGSVETPPTVAAHAPAEDAAQHAPLTPTQPEPTPPEPAAAGPAMLAPVRWSKDLAAAYREARAKEQLVLLYAVPGDT